MPESRTQFLVGNAEAAGELSCGYACVAVGGVQGEQCESEKYAHGGGVVVGPREEFRGDEKGCFLHFYGELCIFYGALAAVTQQHAGLWFFTAACRMAIVLDVTPEDAAIASVDAVVCIRTCQAYKVTSYSHGDGGICGYGQSGI